MYKLLFSVHSLILHHQFIYNCRSPHGLRSENYTVIIFYIPYVLLSIHFRACLKNHSRNLHAPLCGRFCRKPFSNTL
ncbi:DUF6783 domain-containing protein [Blautia faecis]|uniref:DUF6783 domain-containing protein n=1 Tax=Blautia faecis TaxID=871665 RepID=UPI003A7F40E2